MPVNRSWRVTVDPGWYVRASLRTSATVPVNATFSAAPSTSADSMIQYSIPLCPMALVYVNTYDTSTRELVSIFGAQPDSGSSVRWRNALLILIRYR